MNTPNNHLSIISHSSPLERICIWGALFILLIRILPFANGDLFFDEATTLDVYVLPKSNPFMIFRDYSMANNHILSNLIYWFWISLTGPNIIFMGVLLRLPSILLSIGTLLIAFYGWSPFLGKRKAILAALLMALSPSFCNYVWQVRGYSLIIFLSTLLVTASLWRMKCPTTLNATFIFILSILLALTMPSAVMLPIAIGIALFSAHFFVRHQFCKGISAMAPAFWGVCLGGGYYLTLGQQFWNAAKAANGWDAFWPTFGNIVLAILVHCSIFSWQIPRFYAKVFKTISRHKAKQTGPEADAIFAYPAYLLVSVFLVIFLLLVARNPIYSYPFPRVFILMLVPLTYSVLTPIQIPEQQSGFIKLLAICLSIGILTHLCCEFYITCAQRNPSLQCDNLLLQGGRGSDLSFRMTQTVIQERKETGDAVTIVDGNLVPTVGLYCKLYNYSLLSSGFLAIMDARWITPTILQKAIWKQQKFKILARTKEEAVTLQKQLAKELPSQLILRKQYGDFLYYEVEFSN